MRKSTAQEAFSLIELLVVIAIISLLVSILVPVLSPAKQLARSAKCLMNLHNLSLAMVAYQSENDQYFWPYATGFGPDRVYFWGKPDNPVDPGDSPFMNYVDDTLELLWCPSLNWGSYVPQGGVNEPTTTYGYNAWSLDPALWGRTDAGGRVLPRKRSTDLKDPSELFVFADSAMSWSPSGVGIMQNSTSLDPVDLERWGLNKTPTTHFRHRGKTNALCADGHAESFGPEGGFVNEGSMIGFVGTTNAPHYDEK